LEGAKHKGQVPEIKETTNFFRNSMTKATALQPLKKRKKTRYRTRT